MKLSKSLLACALFLSCSVAGAEPAPGPAAALGDAPALAGAAEDVFGSSLLSLPADCFASDRSTTANATGGGLDRSTCGACSIPVCRYRLVGWVCGVHSGNPKFCQDTYGDVCADGGAYCRCTDTIVP